MNPKDSSSSDTNLLELDLAGSGRLPPLPTAFLAGRDLDLLEPLNFLAPGELPGPPQKTDRKALAEALGDINRFYGVARAAELATKLADPETHVVVTGQQPGIFGGPLLSLSKMIAAVRYAEALEEAGRPAVAVFWVATEDHDWDEAGRSTLPGDEPELWTLGDDADPLVPLGDRRLGAGVDPISNRLQELAKGDEAGARVASVLEFHRADGTFGKAFCRTMATILGDRSPLFLDSQLPALKEAQVPYLRLLIEKRHDLDAAYTAAEKEVTDRGYPLQVTPQPGVSPLFLVHEGRRRRIEWRGQDRYGLRGLDGFESDVEELLRIVDEEPERISPGVLARPSIQDATLGSSLQLMGPAELSYMTQARAAYPLLGIERTWTTLRPQVLAVDPRQVSWMQELGLSLTELLESSVERVVADRFGNDFITPIKEQLLETLDQLEEPVLDIDRSLEKPLQKTKDQITRGLDNFTSRVEAAVARRNETWARRVTQLKHALVPNGALQERSLSTSALWARYGNRLIDAIFRDMRLHKRELDVVRWDREVDS